MAKKIIDVSKYQGQMDYEKVKASGIAAVIIRAGMGKNNIDPLFESHIKGAIKAGLPVGIYYFSYALNTEMAEKEAEYCLKFIEPYRDKITLPVFYDLEYDSVNYFKKMMYREPTKQEVTDFYSAFMGKILTAGYKAGYYTNPDYLFRFIDEKQIDGYYKWLAFYTTVPQTNCDIWQYAAGYIPGCAVKVDMDWLNNESLLKDDPHDKDKDDKDKEDEEMKFSDLKIVRIGDTGYDVRIVQAAVGTAVDGIFGVNTLASVKDFQLANGLFADGVVGELTWTKIWEKLD